MNLLKIIIKYYKCIASTTSLSVGFSDVIANNSLEIFSIQ